MTKTRLMCRLYGTNEIKIDVRKSHVVSMLAVKISLAVLNISTALFVKLAPYFLHLCKQLLLIILK